MALKVPKVGAIAVTVILKVPPAAPKSCANILYDVPEVKLEVTVSLVVEVPAAEATTFVEVEYVVGQTLYIYKSLSPEALYPFIVIV